MNISEISKNNQIILKRANRVAALLNTIKDFNIPIEETDNARLFYLSTATLTTQQKAPLGEKFLRHKLHLERVSPGENRGDAVDANKTYYEFKTSYTNKEENLNIRQIRLWQNVNYYYCIYINEEDLDQSLFFILTKEQMIEEVSLCGGYTHGTVLANLNNQNAEYSITIPIYNDNNAKTKRWKDKYLSSKLKEAVLYVS